MHESILIVDDDKSIVIATRITLQDKYSIHTAKNGSEALEIYRKERPNMILLDIGLPDMSGIEVLEQVKDIDDETIVVLVTAVDEVQTVVKAIKLGAYDYLVKPIDAHELRLTVQNALETRRLKEQIHRIQQPNIERYKFEVIGQSEQIKALLHVARKVAQSPDTPVLIMGESGCGKGVLARAIHYSFSKIPGPFVTVNCTAITHELFESELFGYERGAFTGARSEGKKGRFEEATGGTLFLDEIGSMPFSMQSKLLGVLEDRIFHRVGGVKPIEISSRIIAATNVDLEKAVEEGHFRKDLFFRLNVVKLEIPPLRKRLDDIIPLSEYFIKQYDAKFGKTFTEISPAAREMLVNYQWPGNVRELRNTLERIILLERGSVLLPKHLHFLQGESKPSHPEGPESSSDKILEYDEVVKKLIQDALQKTRGNVMEAARLLNMAPHKMRYRIKKYGIKV